MRPFLALLRREYLEHRWAFLYAPLILIGILLVLVGSALVTGRYRFFVTGVAVASHLFDLAYFGVAVLWWGYCFIAVFFYFADAFNSDRRNNQMFFWKSMPHTDFTMLMSKLIAGLTMLPALVYFALLLTGLLVAAFIVGMPYLVPAIGPIDLQATLFAWSQVSALALCYLVLALLWYAPFFAWVGALSTLVGRWSIPLALLIPVILSLFEGLFTFGAAPGGSYILSFLRNRLTFNFVPTPLQQALIAGGPIDLPGQTQNLLAAIDWPLLVLGLIFAIVVIFLASEFRRRWVLKG